MKKVILAALCVFMAGFFAFRETKISAPVTIRVIPYSSVVAVNTPNTTPLLLSTPDKKASPLKSALKSDSEVIEALEKYQALQKVVLPSQETKHARDEMLMDQNLIASTVEIFATSSKTATNMDKQEARMDAILFLNDAIRKDPQPHRDFIFDEIEALLASNLPDMGAKDEVAQSFIGDRIELFMMVFQHDPGRIAKLFQEARTPQLKAFYRAASVKTRERIQRELDLDKRRS